MAGMTVIVFRLLQTYFDYFFTAIIESLTVWGFMIGFRIWTCTNIDFGIEVSGWFTLT